MEVVSVVKLLKLEMKKVKMSGFIKGVLLCNLVITGLLLIIILNSKHTEHFPFKTLDQVSLFLQTMIQNTFIIFASVLISRFIIDEYKNKTITVLFMYPVNRKKLIITKLLIIMVFTFTSIVFSTIFIGIELYILNHLYSFLLVNPTNSDIMKNLYRLLINALATSCLSLIPLYFGMRKKTVPATIVTAVIIVAIIGSNNGGVSLLSYIAIPVTLGIIGVSIAYLSFRNIERKDIDN